MSAAVEPATVGFAPLYVEWVRLRDFRGLGSCELELEPRLTVLVGRNNAGKSRILRALAIAFGGLPAELDDLTVGGPDVATIDIVVAPPPPTSAEEAEEFDAAVTQRLGGVPILREEPVRERFAWRTTIRRSAEGFGARSEMQTLTYDAVHQDWILQQNANQLTRDQRQLFAADLVDTRRDLMEELGRRGTAIRRVLSDLEVPADPREALEAELSDLNARIVDASSTLAAVKAALAGLEALDGIGAPTLSPLPVRLEELARSVTIDFDTGGGALPIRLQGAGARSMGSLQVQSVLYQRRLGQDGPLLRPHPLTLVEEPEAHLHPQAIAELSQLLNTTTGQVVVSTHSSHLATVVEPRSIRLVRVASGGTTIVDLGPVQEPGADTHRALRPSTHASEMEKLKRLVERPFGELLFSSLVIIGDGATERAFLPLILRYALGTNADGVCVVDPESMGSAVAQATVKFANLVGIPWLLFSDSDATGTTDAQGLIDQHAGGDQARVVWAVAPGSGGGAIERMLLSFDEDLCRDACLAVRPDLNPGLPALDLLTQLKGSVGTALARGLIEKYPTSSGWPSPLVELVQRVNNAL